MLSTILTSLALVSALVGIVAWCVGFASAARATAHRARQVLSTDVKALQRPEAVTAAERDEAVVTGLKVRMWKSMLVFVVAIAVAAGLLFLRDWATGTTP